MKYVNDSPSVIALSGGIGGAKLALGLSNALSSRSLMIIGNIGDDFVHYGLHISPDLDTLCILFLEIRTQKKAGD